MSNRFNWRLIGWGGAAALLALPFVAMQFDSGVRWSGSDFLIFGVMLLAVGIPLELAANASSSWSYRAGAALALLAGFLTMWVNLAVGIVGSEQNPANVLFFAALIVGIAGAALARFRAGGMAVAMAVTAAAIGLAFVTATLGRTDEPAVSHWTELAGTSIFAILFLLSALLFRRSAGEQP